MAEQQRTGIPASIKMAQAILESGAGKGSLVQRSNNHFGIKCKSTWTGLTALHDDDTTNECFRAYETAQQSFEDHSNFLKSGLRYRFLFDIPVKDYKGWADGLRKAGYATNPKYASIICRVIETYNLQQLTEFASSGSFISEDWASLLQESYNVPGKPQLQPMEAVSKIAIIQHTEQNPALTRTTAQTKLRFSPEDVISHNNLKAIYIPENSTWPVLSARFGIPIEKLLRFNDLLSTDLPESGKLIYLQEKNDKAPSPTYLTKKGETLWSISQQFGVKLDQIAIKNNFPVTLALPAGALIHLPN